MDKQNTKTNHKRQLIGAIDQGTSSTRFLVFEAGSRQVVGSSQIEIKRIVPKEGWVEFDPYEIIRTVNWTISEVCNQLKLEHKGDNYSTLASNFKSVGICNQRESTVVWDRESGKPLYNVIVWMDNRTKDIVDRMIDSVPGRDFNWFKHKTGLPMSTYFSAFKLKWLIDNVEAVKLALKEDRLMFGTVDTWILWNLTGDRHLTDVTNASRTFLMDIESLDWDESLCDYFKIPLKILPKILSSADDFGSIQSGPLKGVPITGVIGDQSAALFGHKCLQMGQTKATFGTGCFIMQNIGQGPISGALKGTHRNSKRGLITTVGYKLGKQPACYALEGSVKIAGAAITWLRDNLQLIQNYEECDQLVNITTNSAGVFFVPALGGLYAPYWDPNAAGIYIGLSQFSRREHMVRATFDSIAFQTNDILSLMRGVTSGLMIDGGLCKSDNLCQILADITGCDIVRPSLCETSALGAALVAGCGAGIWSYETIIAKNSVDFYGGSEYGDVQHNHYPPESLNYEAEFSSLIQRKSSQISSSAADLTTTANLTEGLLVSQSKTEALNAAIGVNDDAGGGGLFNYDAGGGSNSLTIDDELEFGSSIETVGSRTDEINAMVNECDKFNTPSSIYAPTSSAYSSVDNFDQSSLINSSNSSNNNNQRQDSPFSESSETEKTSLILEQVPQTNEPIQAAAADTQSSGVSVSLSGSNSLSSDESIGTSQQQIPKQVDVFQSYISLEHRTDLVHTWHRAVERSMNWTKIHHEEIRRIDYQRLSSIPISVYLFVSVGMIALSEIMSCSG